MAVRISACHCVDINSKLEAYCSTFARSQMPNINLLHETTEHTVPLNSRVDEEK